MLWKTEQIRWHFNLEKNFPTPVFSVDFQPGPESWRLATCGADNSAKTWRVDETGKVEFLAELAHSSSVNVLRFSPNGKFLATGSDSGAVYVWQLQGGATDEAAEQWSCVLSFSGHVAEVYDLAWAPSSLQLLSGSLDNTVIVWELQEADGSWKGRNIQHLKDHKQFVQGVAWHPGGRQVASQSSDGSVRIYNRNEKKKSFTASHAVSKLLLSPATETERAKYARLYVEDVKATFFRRLAYSPDGALLVTPSGYNGDGGEDYNCFYLFRTVSPSSPVARVGASSTTAIAVRFNPLRFKPRETQAPALFEGLASRLIYAVATADACLLFDTQQREPFASLAHLHLAPLTDLAWSADGNMLAMASQDGYVSLVTFEARDFDPSATSMADIVVTDAATLEPIVEPALDEAGAPEGEQADVPPAEPVPVPMDVIGH